MITNYGLGSVIMPIHLPYLLAYPGQIAEVLELSVRLELAEGKTIPSKSR